MIKVKQRGKGTYYGEPRRRVPSLVGADKTEFKFEDPVFVKPDFQNGQAKLSGPFLNFYYRPA